MKPGPSLQRLEVTDARLVGRYAISLCWSDGHDTGIYTLENLRALCQCPVCLEKQ